MNYIKNLDNDNNQINSSPILSIKNPILGKKPSQKNSLNLSYIKERLNFDEILENRIGFGKYQFLTVLILCLVDFNDGIELLSMSLIIPILKREWQIEKLCIEIISSVFYFGMLIGAVITGKISDRYGRRITILISSSIQFVITLCFCFVNSIFFLIILRFIYGIIYGFSLPLSISMVSEIIPLRFRGKLIVLTNFCVSLGKIWGIFLAYLIFNDFNDGNWRLMMALCSITPFLVILGIFLFVKESPRFLLSIGNFQKGFDIIDHIGYLNHENKSVLYINTQNNIYHHLNKSSSLKTYNKSINNENHFETVFEENNQIKEDINYNKKSLMITNDNNINQNNHPIDKNLSNKENESIDIKNSSIIRDNNKISIGNCNLTFDDDLEKFNNYQVPDNSDIYDNYKKTPDNDTNCYAYHNYLNAHTKSDIPMSFISPNIINENSNNGRYDEINNYKNNRLNSDYIPLSNTEKKSLINFYISSFNKEESGNYRVLLRHNIFPITIRLWICWFALIFIEFGQYAILPFILISQNNGFATLLFAIFGEIPSILLSTLMIDWKNFGRKNSLTIFLLILSIFNIIIYWSPIHLFGLLISIERFFMKNCFSMLIPLTSELYPTNVRTVGYGVSTGIGRFAATICPFILFPLFYWNSLSIFIIFAILSIFACISIYTLKFETSGKYLDCLLLDNTQIH